MATIETPWLTADAFRRLADDGAARELVRGRIVITSRPGARHGWVCNRVGRIVGNFVEQHDLGFVLNNDAGVVTETDPDTVRGPDVAYYSYARMPKGDGLPEDYPAVAPDLVFEVLSPHDRFATMLRRVAEFLGVGVRCVCVLDPKDRRVVVYVPDGPETTLTAEEMLSLENVLPGFRVVVGEFFGAG